MRRWRSASRGRAGAEIAAWRRPRRPRRDPAPTIPTIWCCSMPAPGWARCSCRSTGALPCRSSSSSSRDAGAKALVVEQAFAPIIAPLAAGIAERARRRPRFRAGRRRLVFDALLARGVATAAARTSIQPLPAAHRLHLGHDRAPKGAVLRQDALVGNAAMSQHMHDMTARRSCAHRAAAVPCRRAQHPDHAGAAAGRHRHSARALRTGRDAGGHRARPADADRAGAGHHPGHDRASALGETDLDSLRAVTTGSTQVPQRLIDAFTARGVPVLQVYGSTETCPIAVYTRLGGDLAPAGLDRAARACAARRAIVDDAGDEVPPGTAGRSRGARTQRALRILGQRSRRRAEALREGWYHTGDIGTRDADGHFFIHDRKKNLIISGGENIYPAEIERVLREHPAVADAAVIGRADRSWQEVPVAYVVPRQARCGADRPRSRRFCLAQLARYKVPREYRVRGRACRAMPWARCSISGSGDCGPDAATRRRRRSRRSMKIAVLGGGNGSFAAAGDLALAGPRGAPVAARPGAIERTSAGGLGIPVKDFDGRHEARLALITADIGAAVRGAELILCPTPATAQARHRARARAASRDGQVVFLPPGTFGSVLFAKAARDAGNRADVAFAETGTLPWLTRKHGPFEVAITIRAKRLPTGVFPLRDAEHALAVIGARLSRRDRAVRRRAVGRADECRADHPSAADRHECRRRWSISSAGTSTRKARSPRSAASPTRSTASASPCARRWATARRIFRSPTTTRSEGEEWMYGRGSHDKLDRLRRLARAHRADATSLHAGGYPPRSVLPGLGRRAGRRRHAACDGVPGHRRRDLRRGFLRDGPHAREPGLGNLDRAGLQRCWRGFR